MVTHRLLWHLVSAMRVTGRVYVDRLWQVITSLVSVRQHFFIVQFTHGSTGKSLCRSGLVSSQPDDVGHESDDSSQ